MIKKSNFKVSPQKMASSSREEDILKIILQDHAPLKKLIKTMKDLEEDRGKRQQAFEEFAPLLTAHAKAEEGVLYPFMKNIDDFKELAFEGDVEHSLAEQMIDEINAVSDFPIDQYKDQQTDQQDVWSAKVKVLAEVVEHHIEEEEEEIFPDFRKCSAKEERIELGKDYLKAKSEAETQQRDDERTQKDLEVRAY